MNIDVSPNSGFTGAYDSVNNAAAGNPIIIIALFVIILVIYMIYIWKNRKLRPSVLEENEPL